MLRLDGDHALSFREAREIVARDRGRIEGLDPHLHFPAMARNQDGSSRLARRNAAPVDGHRHPGVRVRRTLGNPEHDPRCVDSGREFQRTATAVEHIEIRSLPVEGIEPRQGGLGFDGLSPALDGHAERGHVGRHGFDEFQVIEAVDRRIAPRRVAQHRLVHEVRPFAAGEVAIVVIRHGHEFAKQPPRFPRLRARARATLFRVQCIAARGEVEFVDQCAGLGREEHELMEGIALPGREHRRDLLRRLRDGLIIRDDLLRLAIIRQAVGIGREHLGFPAAVVF